LEWKHPEFYDPKYGWRLTQLRARVAKAPGRPLMVVLGSSRAEQGFRPGLLTASHGDTGPLIYNLARGGSSPLLHLVTLHRLLSDGPRPDLVLLEVFPPSLVEDEAGVALPKISLRDLAVLRRYPVPWSTYTGFVRDRALFWPTYRAGLVADFALAGLSTGGSWGKHLWERGGEWREISEGATPEERRDLTADSGRRYYRKLQDFCVATDADRALRALLDLAHDRGIGVVLFLMPEASEFRSWYTPAALERLSAYLASLQQDYGLPLIDARRWISDDDFWDGHHLLRHGAATFTERFGSRILSLESSGKHCRP
jgi:hypothetical protein